jgi:adenylate kinase
MNVLLIGPPGAGKGTQGARLAERLHLDHIAVGDLLRAEVEAGSELGTEVAGLMKRGELVPDQIIIDLLQPRLEAAAQDNGFLLDGFPRTVQQAQVARDMAEQGGFLADAAVYLDAPRAELVKRILARAEVEGRADDTPEVIEARLRVFDEATKPLVDYYRQRGVLQVVDADRDPDAVTEDIVRILEAL